MNWIIVCGSLCLGTLIGAMVAWFFSAAQATGLNVKVLAGSVSALVGSSVLAMLAVLAGTGSQTSELWFYPIGLLLGFSFIMVLEYYHYDYYGKKRIRKRKKSKKK